MLGQGVRHASIGQGNEVIGDELEVRIRSVRFDSL